MQRDDREWGKPLPMAITSLVIALCVAFLPLWIDKVRAQRRAKPIQIIAAPGVVAHLSYRTNAEVTPAPAESIAVTVAITNIGPDSTRATVSLNCPVVFQLREVADAAGRPRWDGRHPACPAAGREVTLGPGQVELLRTARSVGDVLGDSLRAGRYHVTAIFGIDGSAITRFAGALTFTRSTH